MQSRLYWVATEGPRLAIMPRPRAGEYLRDEIESFRDQGLDVVVSLLTEAEAFELDLRAEETVCGECGLRYFSFPIEDRAVPAHNTGAAELIQRLKLELMSGKCVGIHCRIGIGRSAMIAAALLGALGTPAEDAFRRIAAARGCEVPDTPEQRAWVEGFLKMLRSSQ